MNDPYRLLAERLDALPNGFPSTPDGAELRLLAKLFTLEEAALAAHLTTELQSPTKIAAELASDVDPKALGQTLKSMARKGLIDAGRTTDGMGYKLLPFVVGIYEMQIGRIDAELARLFEHYYTQNFGQALRIQPAFHRVIPVQESVRVDMEVRPYESAAEIVARAQSWGVLDCICRTQKALIGQACEHPIDVCMAMGSREGMFDNNPTIRPLTFQQAHDTLRRAASAGLVHTVSNSQEGVWYICNCCTCSCGILRGMAELGIANAVARSPFVNQVDQDRCIACEACLSYCQFDALALNDGHAQVVEMRCIGCGVCVPSCPEEALSLVRRPESEILPVPADHAEWELLRVKARKL
jgi:Na+-translocating ferredoxin:NAD+ oxidoreductase subunit B